MPVAPQKRRLFARIGRVIKGHTQTSRVFIDHLGGEQRLRHGEVERLRGLEIGQKPNLVRVPSASCALWPMWLALSLACAAFE